MKKLFTWMWANKLVSLLLILFIAGTFVFGLAFLGARTKEKVTYVERPPVYASAPAEEKEKEKEASPAPAAEMMTKAEAMELVRQEMARERAAAAEAERLRKEQEARELAESNRLKAEQAKDAKIQELAAKVAELEKAKTAPAPAPAPAEKKSEVEAQVERNVPQGRTGARLEERDGTLRFNPTVDVQVPVVESVEKFTVGKNTFYVLRNGEGRLVTVGENFTGQLGEIDFRCKRPEGKLAMMSEGLPPRFHIKAGRCPVVIVAGS